MLRYADAGSLSWPEVLSSWLRQAWIQTLRWGGLETASTIQSHLAVIHQPGTHSGRLVLSAQTLAHAHGLDVPHLLGL